MDKITMFMLLDKHEHHMQQYSIILFALIYYYTSGIGMLLVFNLLFCDI
jgi:hypothetical protein